MAEETTIEEAPATREVTEAPEPQELVAPKEDPLLQALWKDLGRVENVVEEDITPAPDAEATTEEKLPLPHADEMPAAEDEDRSKVSLRHQPMLTEDGVRDIVREEVSEVQPTESVTEPVDEEPDPEAGLLEEQKEEIELARLAEKNYPDKYQGLPDKLLSYYTKLEEYAKESMEEDPSRSFDDDDMEYQDWVQRNRPKFSDRDRKRVERVLIENNAYERAKEEVTNQYSELEKRQKALEVKPKVDSQIKSFEDSILKASSSDAAKSIIKSGYESTSDSYPLETAVLEDTVTRAKLLANEYLGFVHGLKEFDYNDPNHKWLLEFINNNGEWFEKNGGDAKDKGGKSFVSRARYAELHAAGKASTHWTFDHDDILNLLSTNALHEADFKIKSTLETAEKYGFTRVDTSNSASEPNQQEQVQEEEPDIQPVYPPRASPSIGPGTADSGTSAQGQQMGTDVLSALGMK